MFFCIFIELIKDAPQLDVESRLLTSHRPEMNIEKVYRTCADPITPNPSTCRTRDRRSSYLQQIELKDCSVEVL